MKKQGLIPIRPIRDRITPVGTAIAICFVLISILIIETPLRVPAGKAGSADLWLRSAAVVDDSVTGRAPQAAQPRLQESYGKLPLSFEINRGQTDPQVKFLSRGNGYSLFLTGSEAVLALKKPGARSQKPSAAFKSAHPGSADLAFRSAAFPGLLRSPVEINSRTADPKSATGAGPKPRIASLSHGAHETSGRQPAGEGQRTGRIAGQVELLHRQ